MLFKLSSFSAARHMYFSSRERTMNLQEALACGVVEGAAGLGCSLFHETPVHIGRRRGVHEHTQNWNTVGAAGSEAKTTQRVGLKDTTDETDSDGYDPSRVPQSGQRIRAFSRIRIIRCIRKIRVPS